MSSKDRCSTEKDQRMRVGMHNLMWHENYHGTPSAGPYAKSIRLSVKVGLSFLFRVKIASGEHELEE